MSAQENKKLARTIYEQFSNDEFDRILEQTVEDVKIVFVPAGQTMQGHEGFRQFMGGFKNAFPNITLELTNQVATDDQVVSEFIARGDHTGPLQSPNGEIPATGRHAEWEVCEVWQVRDGKLAQISNYQDTATMLRQLGLLQEQG